MAKTLQEFDALLANAVRTAQVTGDQGCTEPLPSAFDPQTDQQLRTLAFGFDKIFGTRNGK